MVKDNIPLKRLHTQLPRDSYIQSERRRSQKKKERQRAGRRKGRARERKKAYCHCLSQGRRRTLMSLLSKAPVAAFCTREHSVERGPPPPQSPSWTYLVWPRLIHARRTIVTPKVVVAVVGASLEPASHVIRRPIPRLSRFCPKLGL